MSDRKDRDPRAEIEGAVTKGGLNDRPTTLEIGALPYREGDLLAGKYRVERVIGVGGMGVVVAAMHVTLHQKVALKLMLPGALSNGEAVERFVREARAAAQLRSEHVARVLDVGTLEGGEPFMVMELLEGYDLDELLRRQKPLPIADAIDFTIQACDAVAEAHHRGIVHRDLKPGNLFLATDARGRTRIKVLDFGISKTTTHGTTISDLALTKTSAVMGSPLYMSPEQMRATRDVDARSDVWSLGVTLYQLLVGRVPFFAESPMALGAKVLHEEPTPPEELRPEVSPALSSVVLRCLAKDPNARFATVGELAAALEESLSSSTMGVGRSTYTSLDQARVLVATSAADGGAALPYSHTALAHSRTGGAAPPRRRPVVFAVLTLLALGSIVLAMRVRPREETVAASDVTPQPIAAEAAAPTPNDSPFALREPPPPRFDAPAPVPPASRDATSPLGGSAPLPHSKPGIPRHDKPPSGTTTTAPDASTPSPAGSANPLDYL